MKQEKRTLKLKKSPSIIKNAILSYIMGILVLIGLVSIGIYNGYHNDFETLSLIFTHTHPVVIGIILTLSSVIFILVHLNATAMARASLTLDNQGVRYYSGMPFGIGEDWDLSWDDISEIQVTPLGEIIFITRHHIFGSSYRTDLKTLIKMLN